VPQCANASLSVNMVTSLTRRMFSANGRSGFARANQLRISRLELATVWLAVALVVLAAALIRIRLLDIPLERDEGEYAYAGQLILQGVPPYRLAYNMKLPGTYAAYAVILALFGESPAGIHFGLLAVNALTIVLVFLLARTLFSASAGVAAAASYALLSVGTGVLGTAAHATHFVALAALGGVLLLCRALHRGGGLALAASGFLFGLSFLMKQHGAFFVLFGVFFLVWNSRRDGLDWRATFRRACWLAAGAALPLALTVLILWRAGVLERFWFWTFLYARQYVSLVPASEAFANLVAFTIVAAHKAFLIWVVGLAGLVLFYRLEKRPEHRMFFTSFLICSALAVCPGFYFRGHYFVQLLPGIALCCAAAVHLSVPRIGRGLTTGIFVAVLVASALQQKTFLFQASPLEALREMDPRNPFSETAEVAKYVRSRSAADARIAVVGSEPQIYFLANRRSVTGYLYTFALGESHPYARRMQEEMIGEIEAASPDFLVLEHVPISPWLPTGDPPQPIVDWAMEFTRGYYERVGVVDMLGPGSTEYRWDRAAAHGSPASQKFILVFRRRPAAVEDVRRPRRNAN
jgi:hypothetical protein